MRNKQSTHGARGGAASAPIASRTGSERATSKPRFGWYWALAYLLAVTIACYLPALLLGRTFLTADLVMLMPPWAQHAAQIAPDWQRVARPAWDPLFYFYPSRMFLAQSIHAGLVPWHNPHWYSGGPFIGDDQSAFFYPINWLFAVLPLASAFGIVSALHTFLAGAFFALFARGKRLGWEASLAGGTAWMLCGTMVAWQMWQVVDATLCWLPLGLYFTDRITDDCRTHDRAVDGGGGSATTASIIGLAASICMILLAGHLQFGFCDLMVIALYAVRSLCVRRGIRPAAALVASVALGIGLAAAQILPTLDLLHNSLRASYSIPQLLSTALAPSQLSLLVMPEIAGGERNWPQYPYVGAVNYWEVTCYVGASALLFATLAFLAKPRERRVGAWFWTAIALLGILIGCGTPVYSLFYYGVPLFKSFHGVSRMLVMTDFAVAALCALGVQALLDRKDEREARRFILRATFGVGLVAVALYGITASRAGGLLSSLLTHEWLQYGLGRLVQALVLIIAAALSAGYLLKRHAWVAVVLVAADMSWFAAGLNPGAPADMLYPNLPIVGSMKQTAGSGRVLTLGAGAAFTKQMVPNSAMSVGLNDIQGSDAILLADYDRFSKLLSSATALTALSGGHDGFIHGDCGALDYLNVRALISPVPLTGTRYPISASGEVFVYSNPDAVGEARLAGSWTVNSDPSAGWARILAARPGPTVFVSERPRFGSRTVIAAMPVHGRPGVTQNVSRGIESVDASVATPGPDIVTFSEIADPAWKAYVDGRKAQWLTVDGLFVGVPVSVGMHRIELRYLPAPGLVGVYIMCLSWLIVALLVGYWRGRRTGRIAVKRA